MVIISSSPPPPHAVAFRAEPLCSPRAHHPGGDQARLVRRRQRRGPQGRREADRRSGARAGRRDRCNQVPRVLRADAEGPEGGVRRGCPGSASKRVYTSISAYGYCMHLLLNHLAFYASSKAYHISM